MAAPGAQARDPGRWLFTGASSIPITYWQGLTSDPPGRRVFFVGVFEGLWRTTPGLRQTAGAGAGIPPTVTAAEGYNHIGDPTWNGDRLLLPMECYDSATGTNTCGNGAFGIADPATLAWRFYVKLDPAEIPKAMWAETSPDGKLIWTSSGNDLLAYRTSDVTPAHAAPAAGPIRAARRLAGAVPPSGITGAVFRGGRLLLAGERDGTYQVWAVDTADRQAPARDRAEAVRGVRGARHGRHARRDAALADRSLGQRLQAQLRPVERAPAFHAAPRPAAGCG